MQERDGFRDALFEAQNKARELEAGIDTGKELLIVR